MQKAHEVADVDDYKDKPDHCHELPKQDQLCNVYQIGIHIVSENWVVAQDPLDLLLFLIFVELQDSGHVEKSFALNESNYFDHVEVLLSRIFQRNQTWDWN